MYRSQLMIEGQHYYKVSHPIYKYCMALDIPIFTPITDHRIDAEFFQLSRDGVLTAKTGYHWDGASGPTFDTPSSMRGSLGHDIFYQMLRDGQLLNHKYDKIEHNRLRKTADQMIYTICHTDGMPKWRAKAWYCGIRVFGAKYAKPRYW